jgi:hypothetical protein
MAQKGITLYSVGCEPALLRYKDFFASLAYRTGGQYVPLRNAKLLAKVIVGGAAEEISLEKLLEDAQSEIIELQAKGIHDEAAFATAVKSKLSAKGAVTNQLMMNNANIEKASDMAVNYSKYNSLAELRKNFKSNDVYVLILIVCLFMLLFF